MAQSYKQIQRQIEVLQRQAETLRGQEIKGVVERIKIAIAHYGITSEQLGFGCTRSAPKKPRKPKAAAVDSTSAPTAAYADGNGHVWVGRGPRPHWLRDALASGKSLEDFATSPASTKEKGSTFNKKAPSKRKAKQQYADENGNRWSGFGPKPRWLTEALAEGLTLQQLVA